MDTCDAGGGALDLCALDTRTAWAVDARVRSAGISVELLELQSLLDGVAPLPSERVDALRVLHKRLCASASANALDALAFAGVPRTARQVAAALSDLRARGLEVLSERPGTAYAIRELEFSVDGTAMGKVVLRDLRLVLFHMLQQATLDNFDLVPYDLPGATAAGGDADAPLVSDYFTTPSCAAAVRALEEEYAAVTEAMGLAPRLLAIVSTSDATTTQTTSSIDRTWDPFSITFANFAGHWGAMDPSRGFCALMPVFSNPYKNKRPTRAQYKAYSHNAALVHHAARNLIVQQLCDLRHGFLWELEPGSVVWLVPRLFTRVGDTPAMSEDLALAKNASARRPCRFSDLSSAHRVRVLSAPLRSIASIITGAAARRALASAPLAVRRLALAAVHAAEAQSIKPLGRPPWPLTPDALTVSVRQAVALSGSLDVLHILPHGVMRKTASVAREACIVANSIDQLLARISNLLPFRGLETRLRVPRVATLHKYVEANDQLDLMTVLPTLLTGLVADDEWVPLMHAILMQSRLYASVTQYSYSATDVGVLEQLGRATLRAVRVFVKFRKMIKPSMLPHYARLTRALGALCKMCTTFTEGYHRHVKALADAVAPGPARPLLMMQRHALQQGLGLLVHVDSGRSAAAAAAPLPNLAGRPLRAPKSLPAVLSASEAGFASLGGCVSSAWLSSDRVERVNGPTRYGDARARRRRAASVPRVFRVGPARVEQGCRAVRARAAGLAADPPAGAAAVAAYTQYLVAASRALSWRGEGLTNAHFTPAGALTTAGSVVVCAAADARVHDAVSFASSVTNAIDHPDLRLDGARRFVSVLCLDGHPFAPNGELFVVGEVQAIVTLPARETASRKQLVVVRFASRLADKTGRLIQAVPAADGLLEAWTLASEGALTSYGAVELSAVIRCEHMQPRYGSDDVDVGPKLWRLPEGALRGKPRSLPFPLDDDAGALSDADDDDDGDADGASSGSASPGSSDW